MKPRKILYIQNDKVELIYEIHSNVLYEELNLERHLIRETE